MPSATAMKRTRNHRHDRSKEVQFEDIARAEQVSDDPAYDRPGQPKYERGNKAQILLAGLDEPGKGTYHQPRNDKPLRGWLTPGKGRWSARTDLVSSGPV
ncbi:hypothetical protein [Pseudarthrobacter sp. NamB4]|uniref:hypothetical protein n=1 Tax=Pseudarthrobacter sp. NamB4 TaxID=2576837 RepID=UPI0014854C7A|nr:hypothetical protein [Pseudarthrobacter sp. NamB4]